MKIHEYQAKQILQEFGIPIPFGHVASSADEAEKIARRINGRVAVKAQIHAGARGKGGGIRLAENAAEARMQAGELLGKRLVTPQTGPGGIIVRRLLVERALEIDREFYLGITLDRSRAMPVILASPAGGRDIEELAAESPGKIYRFPVDPAIGLRPFQIRKIAYALKIGKQLVPIFSQIAANLYSTFIAKDCSLAEINPLVVTPDHKMFALDGKIVIDDSSLFRQPEIMEMRDTLDEDPLETEAAGFRLSYIRMQGNIGCMVNGAGLAMATMDMIQYMGGEPANFLDVGGGADVARIGNAFRILVKDDRVRAVLINIFGGIVRCDLVAAGVVEAATELDVTLPIVVRLEGTNVEQGRQIFRKSGLPIEPAADMREAARRVVHEVSLKGDG